MIDIQKLEELAKDAKDRPDVHEWYEKDGGYELDPIDLQFIAAASPAAVLELIAEIDKSRFDRGNSMEEACLLAEDRDQIKATVSDYEMGLEAAKEEIARLKADLAAELQRRWDGNEVTAREHDEEVRKLKGEIEGLRGLLDRAWYSDGNICASREWRDQYRAAMSKGE